MILSKASGFGSPVAGRRSTETWSPRRSWNSSLDAPAVMRVTVSGSPAPGRRSPSHPARRGTSISPAGVAASLMGRTSRLGPTPAKTLAPRPPARASSPRREAIVAWDFSTEPEFQERLDWMDRFVREEIEPLDALRGDRAYHPPNPELRRIVDPLKAEVRRR